MVECQVPILVTAVLAGISVAIEYLVAGHLSLTTGAFNHLRETYDGRQRHGFSDGVNIAESVLEHLRFSLINEHHRAARAAYR